MEDEFEEIASEQRENSKVPPQLQPFQYKKGQSGNPSGRPHGISLKEYARLKFRTMTEDEREDFFNGIAKTEIWKMGEGNPDNKTDITSAGQKIAIDPKTIALAEEFEKKLKDNL
jgi:hypothetical protein